MIFRNVAIALIPSLVLAGCAARTQEQVFLRHESAGATIVRNAPHDGLYRVYPGASGKPTIRSSTPLVERRLARDARIGFERDLRGWVVAVGGDERIPLSGVAPDGSGPTSGYLWTMQCDPGQFDAQRTFRVSAGVIALTAVGLLAAYGGAAAIAASGLFF